METGAKIVTLKDPGDRIMNMAFSPDGTRVAGAVWPGLGYQGTTAVPVWDVRTGDLVKLAGHTAAVTAVAFSPDGSRLATSSEDNTVRVWDPSSGRQLRSVDNRSPAYGLAYSPDGRWLVSGDDAGNLNVWDADTLGAARSCAGTPAPSSTSRSDPRARWSRPAGTGRRRFGISRRA